MRIAFAILNFTRYIYALFGYQTVDYATHTLKLKKIKIAYSIVVILVNVFIVVRNVRHIIIVEAHSDVTSYLIIMEVMEWLTGFFSLCIESFYKTHEKVFIYGRLKVIDRKLRVDSAHVVPKLALFILICLIYSFVTYSYDFIVWEYEIKDLIGFLKTLYMDLAIMQFVSDLHSNMVRLRILNDHLKSALDDESVDVGKCNVLTTWKLMPSEGNPVEKSIKINVFAWMKIYQDLTDNMMMIIKRFKLLVIYYLYTFM